MRNKRLIPTTKDWFSELDELNSELFMKHGHEQPRPQRRRKMFRDPPARHEPKTPERARP